MTSELYTFRQHLAELKSRAIYSFLFFLISFILAYFLKEKLIEIVLLPINKPVFYTTPGGGLEFVFEVCFLFAAFISIPVITYNIIDFLQPALDKFSKKQIFLLVFLSSLLSFLGIAFAYSISLPAALYFLDSFSDKNVKSLISSSSYISFVIRYLMVFMLIFQLPLVAFICGRLKLVKASYLLKKQRIIIVVIAIISAVLTPTSDVLNLLFLALPMLLLYYISILIIFLVNKK